MSDVSKVKVNGQVYDLKDTVARSQSAAPSYYSTNNWMTNSNVVEIIVSDSMGTYTPGDPCPFSEGQVAILLESDMGAEDYAIAVGVIGTPIPYEDGGTIIGYHAEVNGFTGIMTSTDYQKAMEVGPSYTEINCSSNNITTDANGCYETSISGKSCGAVYVPSGSTNYIITPYSVKVGSGPGASINIGLKFTNLDGTAVASETISSGTVRIFK